MTLQVIGAGFGRTGTMSLKAALEELGFGPCYHMSEVFEHPEHLDTWEAAAEGRPVDWEALFAGYRATVDWPGGAFYQELMQAYPQAKVILTTRDPEKWYDSARSTIYAITRAGTAPVFSLLGRFVPALRTMQRVGSLVEDIAWHNLFDGRFEERSYAVEAFTRWNEGVTRQVPSERLLVFEVRQGWEPLCAFLGVDVPRDAPFPHLNEAEVFHSRVRRMRLVSRAGTALAGFAGVAAGAAVALRLSRRGSPRR